MKPLVDSKEKIIEFIHITGQDKMEEIKQLFLDYTQSLKVDLTSKILRKSLIHYQENMDHRMET
jgi:hypothetical protein